MPLPGTMAVHLDTAHFRIEQPPYQPEQGGLSGSVWPQQPIDRAGQKRKVQPFVQRPPALVAE